MSDATAEPVPGLQPGDFGLIYYVLDATRVGQRVKIGTTTNLKDRLPALAAQTCSRQVPTVLALEGGGLASEVARHYRFADDWIVGEWFNYSVRMREELTDLWDPITFLAMNPRLRQFAGGWQGITGWQDTSMPPGVAAAVEAGCPIDRQWYGWSSPRRREEERNADCYELLCDLVHEAGGNVKLDASLDDGGRISLAPSAESPEPQTLGTDMEGVVRS